MTTTPFFAYRSFWKQPETKKRFYEAGIRQFCVFPANTTNSVGEPYCQYPTNWKWYDTYDFSVVDEQFEDLLAVAPDAKILCMLDLNSPNWLVKNLNGAGMPADSFLGLTDALSTQRWLEATKAYLTALVEHIESHYGERILTYLLACGTTDEWMDYSQGRETAGKLERYRTWCREKGFPEPANIPVWEERFHTTHPLGLRDPQTDAAALQYWRFHSDLVADSIIEFSDLVRGMVPDTRKIGVFYGYILQLGSRRLVQCGHLAYEKVLAAESVDYVTSPGIYNDRAMGGGGGFMNVNGTVKRYGKSYFHEIDHATYTSNWDLNEHVSLGWMVNWPDEKASIAGLRREFCRSLLHGSSLWWFDMWGGFYESQNLVDEIGRMQQLWNRHADYAMAPSAEVAVIVDPDSTFLVHDDGDGTIANDLYTSLLTHCNRLGTPYTVYSFNDIGRVPELEHCKLILIPGLFEVTPEKRAILDKHILNRNRTVVWTYGTALSDGQTWNADAMEELTGARFGETDAKIVDKGSWQSVYLPNSAAVTPELLRHHAREAGVHLYTDVPTPVYANERFLAIHVAEGGDRTIRLRKPAHVKELLDNAFKHDFCAAFTYHFNGPATALFELKEVQRAPLNPSTNEL
jgi:hypothetical protein